MPPKIVWVLVGVTAIWLSVILSSIFAPDMVSGSQQEHLKLAALLDWLWGALATMSLLRALRFRQGTEGAWLAVGLGTTAIWLLVLGFSIWGPVVETGSDPTKIPLSAIIAPIAGLLLTRFLVEFTFDIRDGLTEGR